MKSKRISFNETHAEHLYEAILQGGVLDCVECQYLAKRLSKFIGTKDTKRIKQLVKKYPK